MADEICRFFRLIPGIPPPRRAEPVADGLSPLRAYQYCESMRQASAHGFYIYPPLNFALECDGTEIYWHADGAETWEPARHVEFPGSSEHFELVYPFLAAAREPGIIQISTGYWIRTAPGWSSLWSGPVNIPNNQHVEYFQGMVESDTHFEPLFINVRLTKTDTLVEFHQRYPLLQVRPIPYQAYQKLPFAVVEATDFTPADWRDYTATLTRGADQMRRLGDYAAAVRRRLLRPET